MNESKQGPQSEKETGPRVRFRDLTVHNFRAFGDFTISGFRPVNLFVGHNDVGKTSLLEAIWCLTGPHNPQLPLAINIQRGLTSFTPQGENIWGWVFHEHRIGEPIRLEGTLGSPAGKKRTVTYRLEGRLRIRSIGPDVSPDGGAPASSAGSTESDLLRVKYSLAGGETRETTGRVTSKGVVEAEFGPEVSPFEGILLLPQNRSIKEDAQRLSKIEEVGQKDGVLKLLQEVEPRLRNVSIGLVGNEPVARADIGIGRLIPLVLVGQGVYRLFSFAVAVVAKEAGIVLIDEAENGLYYENLPGVWRGLRSLAEQLNVQLFVTTHSRECVAAAYQAFRNGGRDDLAVYRLERHDGGIRAIPYTWGALEAAFASDLEVR